MVVINLNPLLEYDAYYLLVGLLERPNLRLRASALVLLSAVSIVGELSGVRPGT